MTGTEQAAPAPTPPLTTTDDELETGLKIIEEAFASTPGTMPLYTPSEGFSTSSTVEARL